MNKENTGWASEFLHRNFTRLLIGCYLLAGFCPLMGERIAQISFFQVSLWGESTSYSPLMFCISLTIFNAALSLQRITDMFKKPVLLASGFAANLLLPALFLYFASLALTCFANQENLQAVVLGLALLSASPAANSSTAYTQNTNGDIPLAMGLILVSLLSGPWLMPTSLHLSNFFAVGDYTHMVTLVTTQSQTLIMVMSVLIPTLLGIFLRPWINRPNGIYTVKVRKNTNSICILLLNYISATVALPRFFSSPDWSFLVLAISFSVLLCATDFLAGWWFARLFRGDRAQCISLSFSVGLNNTGASLLLASPVFSGAPKILITIIFYTLVQNLIAGLCSDYFNARSSK